VTFIAYLEQVSKAGGITKALSCNMLAVTLTTYTAKMIVLHPSLTLMSVSSPLDVFVQKHFSVAQLNS
jgi:hypothetical protein